MGIKRNDILWKGVLEDFFEYFLGMIFRNAEEIFDFLKGFVFLEQELADLMQTNELRHPKIIDKLASALLKTGEQLWVRVHVEVEKKPRSGCAHRMFRYFYRIWDKYEAPIILIAVFFEQPGGDNVSAFNYAFHGTTVDFKFNSLCVSELDQIELSRSDNPFAKVMLIAKLALRKDLGIEEIFNNKVAIARQLLALNLSAEKIRKLIVFLKLYVRFEEKEISDKFDEEIKLLTNKFETMGIIEQVVDLAKQEGMEAGLNEGMKAGLNKAKEDFVKNLLKHTSHSVKEIAKLVDVSEKFVLTIRDGFTHVSR